MLSRFVDEYIFIDLRWNSFCRNILHAFFLGGGGTCGDVILQNALLNVYFKYSCVNFFFIIYHQNSHDTKNNSNRYFISIDVCIKNKNVKSLVTMDSLKQILTSVFRSISSKKVESTIKKPGQDRQHRAESQETGRARGHKQL